MVLPPRVAASAKGGESCSPDAVEDVDENVGVEVLVFDGDDAVGEFCRQRQRRQLTVVTLNDPGGTHWRVVHAGKGEFVTDASENQGQDDSEERRDGPSKPSSTPMALPYHGAVADRRAAAV